MHSSQNEQDTRNYAAFARVPLLEPSDSAEALEYMKRAFEISERFDTPVIVRSTIRISHSKGLVELGERDERGVAPYESQPGEVRDDAGQREAAAARPRLEVRGAARRIAEDLDLNRTEMVADTSLGVVTAGVTYEYVREALPDASVLKLAMLNPLPERLIREFAVARGPARGRRGARPVPHVEAAGAWGSRSRSRRCRGRASTRRG